MFCLKAKYDPNAGLPRSAQTQCDWMHQLFESVVPDIEPAEAHLKACDDLRLKLLAICQQVLRNFLGSQYGEFSVRLRCVGSYGSGLSITGSKMDLALIIEDRNGTDASEKFKLHFPLERAFLSAGYGAQLLSHTRHPILRLCESPGTGLLSALWAQLHHSERRECSANDLQAHDTASKPINLPKMGVGQHCLIHLCDPLAAHRTKMLRAYTRWDPRIREMVLFVKLWAQARGINRPEQGTLSSFGYTLMVLHYALNIAEPPLAPNLQSIAQIRSEGGSLPSTCNGHNVEYWSDLRQIKKMAQGGLLFRNPKSIGELLRGFFRFYGWEGGKCPYDRFNWELSAISISSNGGIRCKSDQGWEQARWRNVSLCGRTNKDTRVKDYYLLAIEDPFDKSTNVARQLNWAGYSALRAEFQRARRVIRHVGVIEEDRIDLLEDTRGKIPNYRNIGGFRAQQTPSSSGLRSRLKKPNVPVKEDEPPLVDLRLDGSMDWFGNESEGQWVEERYAGDLQELSEFPPLTTATSPNLLFTGTPTMLEDFVRACLGKYCEGDLFHSGLSRIDLDVFSS